MVAGAKPAARGEVHGGLGACGGVQAGVVSSAVYPSPTHNQVVGFAIGWHQGEHFCGTPESDACATYISIQANEAMQLQ